MRPTWMTIAVVPALIAAVVGASTTGILLQLAPSYTQGSEKAGLGESSAKQGALTAKEKPVLTPVEASEHPQPSKPQNFPSAKEENPKKESDPWWATLIDHVAWPITTLAALIFIAYNSRLGKIFGFGTRLVKKISAGGVDIEINSETVELVQRQLHDTFTDLVNGAGDEYDRIAQIQDVPELLKNTIVTLFLRVSPLLEEQFT